LPANIDFSAAQRARENLYNFKARLDFLPNFGTIGFDFDWQGVDEPNVLVVASQQLQLLASLRD
jgi:hypothetical protein